MSYEFAVDYPTFAVTASHERARLWFNRGLAWVYGFNHEEAVSCFRSALEVDETCAMAWWGVAYASGPFLNMPWERFSKAELCEAIPMCRSAMTLAQRHSSHVTDVENAIIQATSARYPANTELSQECFAQLERDYAQAMGEVYRTFPDHPDVATLYVDALMMLTPWQLWDVGKGVIKDGAATREIIEALERTLNRGGSDHLGVLHYYIHALEMSPEPEKALMAAKRLGVVSPSDIGHLHHMPAHIFTQCGMYADAIEVSEHAVSADDHFLAKRGTKLFYTTSICHDLHMLVYAAMQCGRHATALDAARKIQAIVMPELLRARPGHMAHTLEGYYSTTEHVMVRFGMWQEVIEAPEPPEPDLFKVTHAMHHYAKAVAFGAMAMLDDAVQAERRFEEAYSLVEPDRMFFNNLARDILDVARCMMQGEIAYRRSNYTIAFAQLRKAAELDDALHYTEPWAWMHAPRHALGALLLEQGHIAEATLVYLDDLGMTENLPRCQRHPDNIWALHGLAECWTRLGDFRAGSAIRRLEAKTHISDIAIHASCCCRKETFSLKPAHSASGQSTQRAFLGSK